MKIVIIKNQLVLLIPQIIDVLIWVVKIIQEMNLLMKYVILGWIHVQLIEYKLNALLFQIIAYQVILIIVSEQE